MHAFDFRHPLWSHLASGFTTTFVVTLSIVFTPPSSFVTLSTVLSPLLLVKQFFKDMCLHDAL